MDDDEEDFWDDCFEVRSREGTAWELLDPDASGRALEDSEWKDEADRFLLIAAT